MLASLQKNFPSVLGANFDVSNASITVNIKKSASTEPRRILHALLDSHPYIKSAIIVDDDIDINSPRDVDWAVGNRFQADRDLIVLDHVAGSSIDPSCEEAGITAKMGLDATKPFNDAWRFERGPYPSNKVDLKKWLTEEQVAAVRAQQSDYARTCAKHGW